jgi:hypothetical protein
MLHLDRWLSRKFSPLTLPATGRGRERAQVKRSARCRDITGMAIQTQPTAVQDDPTTERARASWMAAKMAQLAQG